MKSKVTNQTLCRLCNLFSLALENHKKNIEYVGSGISGFKLVGPSYY